MQSGGEMYIWNKDNTSYDSRTHKIWKDAVAYSRKDNGVFDMAHYSYRLSPVHPVTEGLFNDDCWVLAKDPFKEFFVDA